MDSYSLLLFVHLLLFVFWLGTDVGVFLAAKISERGELAVETRATVLRLGMILDRLPRSALTLIVPTGLQLAAWSGRIALPGWITDFVWLISGVWLAILWLGFLNPESPTERRAMAFNFAMNVVAAIAVGLFALYLFAATDVPLWLAIKVAAVGAVFVVGVLLDIRFKPAVAAFVDIVANGASEARNDTYSGAIGPVYPLVLAIYALVLVAAWFGIAKVPV